MKIENQAMMFAYLCKYTVLAHGEEGRATIRKGMLRYGRERGTRMAARARTAGDPVDLWTNQAYGEWKPDYAGQMEFGTLRNGPTFRTYISKCAWCDAWRKYDILEYGREYCVNVDAAVYEGFWTGAADTGDGVDTGDGAVCTQLTTPMSWGGVRCEFDWGKPLTDEEVELIAAKKAELGTSAIRDFAFHTAHIYHAISETIRESFPGDADEIIGRAVSDYIGLFGQESFSRIVELVNTEFA